MIDNTTGSSRGFLAAVDAAREQTAARLADLPVSRGDVRGDNVEEAGRKFEALFLSMLCKEMRKTLGDGLFGSGPGADTYEGWFDQHMGDSLAGAKALDLVGILRAGLPKDGTLRADPDRDPAPSLAARAAPTAPAAQRPTETEGS